MTNALITLSSSRLRQLADLLDQVGLDEAAHFAQRFADDQANRAVTVLIAGEFKRGKSSLVNALIGENLLPVDIVPTTAVTHVLHQGERRLVLHWRDGRDEDRPLDSDQLRHLATNEAGGSVDAEAIEFAEIFHPSPRLDGGLVLVDTPGTNDLSQLRSEVVYKMIPRADAVVFVLDGTTQLTGTEKTFLTDKLLSSFAPPLCFVLNKLDRVDEDEREEILTEARELLQRHLPVTDLTLVGASSREAGVGVVGVARYLDAFLAGGQRHLAAEHKRERVVQELKALATREIQARRELASEGRESLVVRREEARLAVQSLDQRWTRFRDYLGQTGPEALDPLVRQSFRHHCAELERRLRTQVEILPPDVLAKQLPMILEDSFKGWLNSKIPEFTSFMERYRAAMLHEFSQAFGPLVDPKGSVPTDRLTLAPDGFRVTAELQMEKLEVSNASRFGIPGAGALIGLLLAGPIGLAPVGAMVGGLIGNYLLGESAKNKTTEAKQQLSLEMSNLLASEGDRFVGSVLEALSAFMELFASSLENAAGTLGREAEGRCREALSAATAGDAEREERDRRYQALLAALETI